MNTSIYIFTDSASSSDSDPEQPDQLDQPKKAETGEAAGAFYQSLFINYLFINPYSLLNLFLIHYLSKPFYQSLFIT